MKNGCIIVSILTVIALTLLGCGKSDSTLKTLATIGPNANVYGIYQKNGLIVMRKCPDLTIIDTIEDIESKCSFAGQRRFSIQSFKTELKKQFWVEPVRGEAELSDFRPLLKHDLKFLNALETRRENIRTKIAKIEDFIERFPEETGSYESELSELRTELTESGALALVVDDFNQYVENTVQSIIDTAQMIYFRSSNKDKALMVAMIQSLYGNFLVPSINWKPRALTSYTETHNDVETYSSAALPDGRVVYSTDRSKNGIFELWIINPSAPDEKKQLTSYNETHGAVDATSPNVLPDGRIVYSTDRSKDGLFELWIINPSAPDEKQQLTSYDETHNEVDAHYSEVLPDGRIVYSTDRSKDGNWELWTINPSAPDEKQQLTSYNETHDKVGAVDPAVLPDGRIVYSTDRSEDGLFELWVINPSAPDEKQQLTSYNETHDQVEAYDPAVLPDGRIVYSTDRSKSSVFELWIANPVAPDEREQLTSYTDTHGGVDAFDPTVLPDGRIVYSTDRRKDVTFELWILEP